MVARFRKLLLAAGLLALPATGLAQSPPPSLASDRAMPLEVIVNGAKSGAWLLVERAGVLYAPVDAFAEWRLQVRPDAPRLEFRGQEYRALSAIPGFRAKVDYANQSVELLFAPQAFATLRLTQELEKKPVVSEVLPSVFVNYDLSYTAARLRGTATTNDVGVLGELGFSWQGGVLTNSMAARNLSNDRFLGVRRDFVRLETTYTRDFPDQNRTLRLGDTVTRAAMWGRDVFYGGIRYGTNFALTPGFVSQPLPTVQGLSAAPSTVELYVNDVLRQVSNVPTGPFVVDNFPLLTGNGEARLVVRDLLGRETVVVQPFFTSSRLLAANLDDWSVEAGRVRLGLGVESNDYGPGFASATWRHGRSNDVTIEGRAEVSRQRRLLGMGLLSVLPWQVLARAALVGSHEQSLGGGGHWLVGLETEGLRGGASVEVVGSTAKFREIGQDLSVSPVKLQYAGNFLYNTDGFGTFGVGYASITRFDRTRVATVSGNYSMRVLERGSLTLTASRAIAGATGSAYAMTFLMPFDNGRSINATAGRRSGKDDAYLAAVQNPGADSDFGWRVLAGKLQDERRAEAGVYYQGRYGSLSADATKTVASQSAVRLGASGGLVFADGHFFATRRVDESFAVAEVPGYGGVGIGIGSNVLTRTGADGVALIPRLLPYISNSVRIDPKELPINAEIESIELQAVPAWRSAVKLTFPVRGGRGALLKIVFADGEPAPAGGIVRIAGDPETFYVARRGEAFVTGLKPDSRVVLDWNGRQCALAVTLPPENPDEIPRIGPVMCRGVPR
jgi:outer membrane usher protein